MSAEELRPGWRKVKFGDVVRQVKDKVDPETSGIERYVAGEHMNTDDLRIRRWGEVGDGYLGPAFTMRFKPGQVLYGSRRTYLRKVALADFEGICANTTFVVESASDALLPEFLPYVMSAEAFHEHSIKQSKGSVNPYINFSDLKWYEFALPPLDEQQRIVEVLATAQASVDGSRRAVVAARSCWLAVADVAFRGDETTALEHVAEVSLGKKRDPKLLLEGSPVPYLRAANVKDGRFDLDDVLEMNFTPSEQERYDLRPGDVLVTEGCGSISEVGACATWNGSVASEWPNACFQMTLLRLRSLTPGDGRLLHHWARWAFHAGRFAAVASGTSVFHLSAARVRRMNFPVLSPRSSEQVVRHLDGLEALTLAAEAAMQSSVLLARQVREEVLEGGPRVQ